MNLSHLFGVLFFTLAFGSESQAVTISDLLRIQNVWGVKAKISLSVESIPGTLHDSALLKCALEAIDNNDGGLVCEDHEGNPIFTATVTLPPNGKKITFKLDASGIETLQSSITGAVSNWAYERGYNFDESSASYQITSITEASIPIVGSLGTPLLKSGSFKMKGKMSGAIDLNGRDNYQTITKNFTFLMTAVFGPPVTP
jgi:hypothetical protein